MIPIINADEAQIWQTTILDEWVAEAIFGWKWMSFIGIPVKGTPGYPKEMRVRQLMSPKQLRMPEWERHFQLHDAREADGFEPLAYCYCSMGASNALVPHFSGHLSAVAMMEKEVRDRGLWDKYRTQLWAQVTEQSEDLEITDEAKLANADCEDRCISAIAVVNPEWLEKQENRSVAETKEAITRTKIEIIKNPERDSLKASLKSLEKRLAQLLN